jgi:hypothetical protein
LVFLSCINYNGKSKTFQGRLLKYQSMFGYIF